MDKIRLTKIFSFETAHALKGYDGLCKNIHGHSYKLEVTVIGTPIADKSNPKYGMVIDFSDLKQIVNTAIVDKFNHALVLSHDYKNDSSLQISTEEFKVIYVPYQPTSENLLIGFAKIISRKLPDNVRLHHLKLSETATSYAEWWADDNLNNK
ncbi:MAG: 6-pyruvoyl trahydropterin synthase family protein [Bacteroidales bacterium]|jgi:6-pyruvoyltetrahydropterin/6-carboxytetrahydropterin synthase